MDELIEQSHKKESKLSSSIIVFIGCFVIYAAGYIARVNYSVAMESMQTAEVVNEQIAGLISSIYFICYALGQIFNGALADKKSPFVLIAIGLLIIALSNLAMAVLNSHPVLLVLWWAINGFGQSMLWAPVYYVCSNMLNPRMRFTAITLISLTTPVGKVSGNFIAGYSLEQVGWKGVFVTAAIIIAIILVLWITISLSTRRNLIADVKQPKKKAERTEGSPKLWTLLVSSGVLIAMPALVIHGLFLNGAAEWIPTILQKEYGMDGSVAAYLNAIIPAVGVTGVFLSNFIYARVGNNELKGAIISMGASILPVIVLFFLTLSPGSIFGHTAEAVIFVIMYGLLYILQLAFSHLMISLVPARFSAYALAATMSGLSNAINYGGSAISTYGMAIAVKHMPMWILMLIWIALLVIATVLCVLALKKWIEFSKDKQVWIKKQ